MPSPSDNWEDTKDGYQRDDISITIRSVQVESQLDDRSYSGEVFSVDAYYGYHNHQEMAKFTDARPAWEFANLLTRYLDRQGVDPLSISSLTSSMRQHSESNDSYEIPFVVEDMAAADVLSRMAGRNSFVVDEICGASKR